jgi:ribokinase
MNRWAEQLAAVELVVVGSMNVDQIAYCARFPDDGETLVAHRYAQGFGGKGANQAVMAARLGAHVRMIGCLGDDALGDATIANFAAMRVDTAGVARVRGASSGVAPIWVDESGTNRILIVPGANGALTAEHVERELARRAANVVVAQLETPQAATAAAFTMARQRGAVTVFNPAPAARVDAGLLGGVDWLVANESEFLFLGDAAPDGATIAAAATRWECGVVVTLGAAGALVADGTDPAVAVPAPRARAVDTTGAGDAFVGTFAVAIAAGLPPIDAVQLGCVAGALSVQRAGTQTSYATGAEVVAAFELPTAGETGTP